jgi:hypothetical protein
MPDSKFSYTVTKATQNEALLWKIVLEREKAPRWCGNILSLARTGILHSSMPEISYCLRDLACADEGIFFIDYL